MDRSGVKRNSQIWQQLMQQAGITNLRELSRQAGVSELQLLRLQNGLLGKMQLEILVKISQALNISLDELITSFAVDSDLVKDITKQDDGHLKQEYQKLLQEQETIEKQLTQQFQLSSLEILESWLLQWPTVEAAAQKNSQLPAVSLLPLIKPIQRLLTSWGVEAIASVGELIPYDPTYHQLMEGTARPGDLVEVRYLGYRQGEKLLYRAKVSPRASFLLS
jgi:DNA-binding Xre family transcriptional regulator